MSAPALTLLPSPKPRHGRPSRADDLQDELIARRHEETEFAAIAAPLLRRLAYLTHDIGPAAHMTVMHLQALHVRHLRRWTSPDDGEAATA